MTLKQLTSLIIAGAALVGCGNVSDPDSVKLDELKRPQGLTILDKGGGAITLSWAGTNSESKFDGYNIFGMKSTKADLSDLGVTEGKAIQLTNEDGTANTTAKTILQTFNYNIDDPFNTAGSKKATDKEFEYYPVYTKSGDDILLPSCKPKQAGTCVPTTKDNQSDDASISNTVTYDITGLTVGENYCFFIMSSMSGGKKTSEMSSEVACVRPKYKVAVQLKVSTATANVTGKTVGVDVEGKLRAVCASTAGCPTTYATYAASNFEEGGTIATSASVLPLHVENINATDGTRVYFTTGKDAAISDLGYYANGFADPALPKKVPTISSIGSVTNDGGYNVPGQSLRVAQGNHVYVLVMKGATTDTSYYYHWFWVSDATVEVGTAFNTEFRLSKAAGYATN